MRKHLYRLGFLGAVVAFALVGSSPALALSEIHTGGLSTGPVTKTTDTTPATGANSGTGKGDSTNTESHDSATTPTDQEKGKAGLAAGQLKICQDRQHAIDNIMARIANRGQKQLTLFSTIATRTEAFYTSKSVTLSNYAALVADVNAKQAAAQTAVDAVKSASTGFSCDSSDPATSVASFQSALKTEIAALQAYRTAVKNLIVGVKSVVSTTTSNTTSTSNGGNQ